MNRSIALASLAGLLTLTAGCGDDTKSSPAPAKAADTTAGTGGANAGDTGATIDLGDLSIPPGVSISSDCMAMYTTFISALGGLGSGDTTDFSGLPDALRALERSLAPEMQSAAETLAKAYEVLASVLARYDGDFAKAMTDPAAQADLAILNSPEVEQANNDISAFFDTTCPGLNDLGS